MAYFDTGAFSIWPLSTPNIMMIVSFLEPSHPQKCLLKLYCIANKKNFYRIVYTFWISCPVNDGKMKARDEMIPDTEINVIRTAQSEPAGFYSLLFDGLPDLYRTKGT